MKAYVTLNGWHACVWKNHKNKFSKIRIYETLAKYVAFCGSDAKDSIQKHAFFSFSAWLGGGGGQIVTRKPWVCLNISAYD